MPGRNPTETWAADALERGDAEAIMRRVVDDPAYLTTRDYLGPTPLLTAIAYNDPMLVEFMLGHGADPNPAVEGGYTSLHLAVESEHPASVEIVSRLIAAGADIHAMGV